MENNLSQIELIPNKCVRSRIKNEYKELGINYKNIKIVCDTEKYNVKIEIYEILKNDKTELFTFIIDGDYPFHPPKFQYNNNPYSHYLKLPSHRFSDHLKKITNKTCLCCSSLCCKYNWSPAIKLKMFIDELNKIQRYKRIIAYKILCDQIKDNYLIDDVDLYSWIN
jgi:hypothetical protein